MGVGSRNHNDVAATPSAMSVAMVGRSAVAAAAPTRAGRPQHAEDRRHPPGCRGGEHADHEGAHEDPMAIRIPLPRPNPRRSGSRSNSPRRQSRSPPSSHTQSETDEHFHHGDSDCRRRNQSDPSDSRSSHQERGGQHAAGTQAGQQPATCSSGDDACGVEQCERECRAGDWKTDRRKQRRRPQTN